MQIILQHLSPFLDFIKEKKYLLLLIILSLLNIIIYHIYGQKCNIYELEQTKFDSLKMVMSSIIDITFIFLVFVMLFSRKVKLATALTYFITYFWSIANVFYIRYFDCYLNISSLREGVNLLDASIIWNLISQMSLYDSYFIISLFIFFKLIYKVKSSQINIIRLLLLQLVLLISYQLINTIECIKYSALTNLPNWLVKDYSEVQFISPNLTIKKRGILQYQIPTYIYEMIDENNVIPDDSIQNIKSSLIEFSPENNNNEDVRKNLIIILVESYLSMTSNLKIGDEEVTPYLNKLSRDPMNYFNGNMKSQISIGESSDGQFIYMTGLLPLRDRITVTKLKNEHLMSLPKLLKENNKINSARMVIPTSPSMWKQVEMCEKYGFDSLYSKNDLRDNKSNMWLDDEQLFNLAYLQDEQASQPFMSVILTSSMHSPYTDTPESGWNPNFPNHFSKEYCNYLKTCRYTDRQIENYINKLKSLELFDNSIIIITADHEAHNKFLKINDNDYNANLPLYIINSPISLDKDLELRQTQLFPIISNIYGVKCLTIDNPFVDLPFDYEKKIQISTKLILNDIKLK